jgi:hypothetical protein
MPQQPEECLLDHILQVIPQPREAEDVAKKRRDANSVKAASLG